MSNKDNHIDQRVKKLLAANKNKFDSKMASKISSADAAYNKLVAAGIVTKKGYTLRGIEDIHLLQLRVNS